MFTQSQFKRVCNILFALLLLSLVVGIGPVPAQAAPAKSTTMGTAFTYQGQLKSGGGLVNGTCDLQFGLWDAWNVGNQIGSTQTLSPVTITNGLFTVTLDFGSNVFNGDARWLAIAVRCPAGGGSYTPLISRQELTAAPYALALPGLYTLPNATSPNLIGGYSGNGVTNGVVGATISGGGRSSYVNFVSDDYGTVGGGQSNIAGDYSGTTADQTFATVGGGYANNANSKYSTIGGGTGNVAYGGDSATVGGGSYNTAYGGSATVGGGSDNNAIGSSATVGGGLANFSQWQLLHHRRRRCKQHQQHLRHRGRRPFQHCQRQYLHHRRGIYQHYQRQLCDYPRWL